MTPLLRDTWEGLLDLVYPPRCLVCGLTGSEALCADCRARFLPMQSPLCARCGIPARPPLCAGCAEGNAWYFASARAAGHFEGTLRTALLRLKYHGKRRLALPLGEYVAEHLRESAFLPPNVDAILPVPLHPARQRERGFNQSALIAREIGRTLALPVLENCLLRTRYTRPQVRLKADQRESNVAGAFAVRDEARLAGKCLVLFDDVLTTLHTANECARVLTNAGARTVTVLGAARGG